MMPMSRHPVQRALLLVPVAWAMVLTLLAGTDRLEVTAAVFLAGAGIGVSVLLLAGWQRRAQTRVEAVTLADTRDMLQDRLPGHIHLLLRAATAPDREMNARERARLSEVVNAAREVEAALELLTPGSLEAWRKRRGEAAGEARPPTP